MLRVSKVILLSVTFLMASLAFCEPTPDEILNQLKAIQEAQNGLDKSVLQGRKDVLELEKQIRELQFPDPKSTPTTAETKNEASFKMPMAIQTFRALRRAALKMGELVNDSKYKTIAYVGDPAIFARVRLYRGISKTIDDLKAKAGASTNPAMMPATAVLPIARSVIGGFSDVFNYFKSSQVIGGADVTVGPDFLRGAVCNGLRVKNITVHLPDLSLAPADNSALRLKYYELSQRIAELKASSNDKDKKLGADLEIQFKVIDTALTQVDKDSGLTLLSKLEEVESLVNFVDQKKSPLLLAGLGYAGGGYRTHSNPFNGGTVSYTGGINLWYLIIGTNGEAEQANVITEYCGWERLQDEAEDIPRDEF